jgi:ferredoxin
LLLVILVTGVYLTFFYQFGFDSSYQAVASIEANFVGRIMRALHRYASSAAAFTALLHGWRTFFQDRFRGPRWLAWVSGIGMAVLVWIIGITGYWLIWDERAQAINYTLFDILEESRFGVAFLIDTMVSDATGWVFIILVITLHLGLSTLVGLFYWWHIKRLNRPKLLPPSFWMVSIGLFLLLFSVFIPVSLRSQASFDTIASEVPLDLFYLFYLPGMFRYSPWIVGVFLILLVSLFAGIPWILRRRPLPPIRVSQARCIGCTLCEIDCPYLAIRMVERTDESSHPYLAVVDPELCVGCGICVGSCPTMALTLGEMPAEALWEQSIALVTQRAQDQKPVNVTFTCERHAYQGARSLINKPGMRIVPVTCVGMIHPNLLGKTIEAGAESVRVIGCPPEDCGNREGNQILQERLARKRKPFLRSKYKEASITTSWLAPNEFQRALAADLQQSISTAYHLEFKNLDWYKLLPSLIFLCILSYLLILSTAIPYQPSISKQAGLEIIMNHRPGYPLEGQGINLDTSSSSAGITRLILYVDGETLLDESYASRGPENRSKILERFFIEPGRYHVKLLMMDREDPNFTQNLYDTDVNFEAGKILSLYYEDAKIGADPIAGERLYYESSLGTNASCRICHSLEPDENLVGPSFAGIATRAENRVPGLTAEEYIRQSIIDPDAFVVEGYPSGLMIPTLSENLSDEQVDDLVAFLLTLE